MEKGQVVCIDSLPYHSRPLLSGSFLLKIKNKYIKKSKQEIREIFYTEGVDIVYKTHNKKGEIIKKLPEEQLLYALLEEIEKMYNVSKTNTDIGKTTFYKYENGFEYVAKTDSYTLYITHRLDKEDRIEFVTTSEAFAGYKNQKFICTYDKNVLTKVTECEAVAEDIKLDVKSYLGVIEHAQLDITTAVTSSGFSLDNLLINYEWSKK